MQIKIFADNSFESVSAATKDYAAEIKKLQQSIKTNISLMKNRMKGVEPAKKAQALVKSKAGKSTAERAKIQVQINKLRMRYGLGLRTTLVSLRKEIKSLDNAIARDGRRVEKLKALQAKEKTAVKTSIDKAKGKAKAADKAPATRGPRTLTGVQRAIVKQKEVVADVKARIEKAKARPGKGGSQITLGYDLARELAKLRTLNKKKKELSGDDAGKTTTGRISKGHEDKPTSKATHSATKRQAQTKVVKSVPEKKSAAGSGMGAAKPPKSRAVERKIAQEKDEIKRLREAIRSAKAKNGGKLRGGPDYGMQAELKAARARLAKLQGDA